MTVLLQGEAPDHGLHSDCVVAFGARTGVLREERSRAETRPAWILRPNSHAVAIGRDIQGP